MLKSVWVIYVCGSWDTPSLVKASSSELYVCHVYVSCVIAMLRSSHPITALFQAQFAFSESVELLLLLAVAQTDDSPPTAPSPLASAAVTATALGSSEFLVFALGQTNNDIGLHGAEGEDAET